MSPKTLEVIVEALRHEGVTWDLQSAQVAGIGTWLDGATLTTAQLGIFNPIGGAYESARSQIATWCAQGGTNMAAIAAALRINANAYEDRDADVAQSVEGAY